VTAPIAAVVVDHDAGPLLESCVRSLLDDGASPVVVVDNGNPGTAEQSLAPLRAAGHSADVVVISPQQNLGYGAGVNRGMAAVAGMSPAPELVLVSNADLRVHPGGVHALSGALDRHPAWAFVGPCIYDENGEVYPSVRPFPSFIDAAGHALLAQFNPDNRFTRRYKPNAPDGESVAEAGWISGSCFMVRRQAFEELGGFDEAYFMYAEDTDLCWRAHQAGWGVGFTGAASVTHIQGVSTARHPYKMMVAHHRSALRFAARSTRGWRRLALPLAALVLGLRMMVASARLALHR
jgi:N-acetylglucosaminyl-diphospho-decaprenol L-rhamnosyltransferase